MYIKVYPAIKTRVIGSLTRFTDIHPIMRNTVASCAVVFVMKYTNKVGRVA
jgi:hypothetical protein